MCGGGTGVVLCGGGRVWREKEWASLQLDAKRKLPSGAALVVGGCVWVCVGGSAVSCVNRWRCGRRQVEVRVGGLKAAGALGLTAATASAALEALRTNDDCAAECSGGGGMCVGVCEGERCSVREPLALLAAVGGREWWGG